MHLLTSTAVAPTVRQILKSSARSLARPSPDKQDGAHMAEYRHCYRNYVGRRLYVALGSAVDTAANFDAAVQCPNWRRANAHTDGCRPSRIYAWQRQYRDRVGAHTPPAGILWPSTSCRLPGGVEAFGASRYRRCTHSGDFKRWFGVVF